MIVGEGSKTHRVSRGSNSVRLGLATVSIFFGGCGCWAALAPLDGAVVSSGALIVHGNSKTVQHKDGGIVSALLVQDGDRVEQGQILVRLDDTQIRAAMNVHQAQLAGDRALCARDLAELSNVDSIRLPTDLDRSDPVVQSVMAREEVVFRNHRTLLLEQLHIVDERLAQSREQSTGAMAQHVSAVRALSFGLQQLQALTTLEHMGLAARNTVLELARSIEALRGEEGQLRSDIARYAAEGAELQAEKLRLNAVSQGDATRELREAQLRINDMMPRLVADRDIMNRLDIRAPVSGQVVDLQAFTRGGVIEPGKPILQVVPSSRRIVAMVQIRPEDIEYVHPGQLARVVAVGFNAREAQPLDGRVDVVSADRLTDPRSGRTYYTAEVSLIGDHHAGTLMKQLSPGMPVEVMVHVKPRTVLDYLLEPLGSSLRSAGREI